MPLDLSRDLLKEISDSTALLVELGLCDDQNFASAKTTAGGIKEITLPGAVSFSAAMKNIKYEDAYSEILETQSFNMQLLDGGLLQLLYRIDSSNKLISHRLSFYSSPSHETFHNDPDLYIEDSIYADFIDKNIVPFPIRFDFNMNDELHKDVIHPKSHLTLGQYSCCRIPVNTPMGPNTFIKFVLRNFYYSAFEKHERIQNIKCLGFMGSITENEKKISHFNTGHSDTTFANI